MHMKGREVYKFAVTKMQEMIDAALSETGLKPEDLKLVIPHQSNLRIIESVREKLGLPKEKVAINIDRYGNTSAASIPEDLRTAIAANAKAEKTFRTLGRQNLFALVFRTNNMKTAAGRARKIASLVAMLARGETIYPER